MGYCFKLMGHKGLNTEKTDGGIPRFRPRGTPAAWLAAIAAAVVLMGTGCAMVGPDYVKPPAPAPEKWLESSSPEIRSQPADFSQWWSVFNDPVLNSLVMSAYRQNLPLQAAGVRVLEARAQLGIAFGNQYPQQQQVNGAATKNQISKNAPNALFSDRYYADYNVGFDAAWELDFWGKFRRAVQSGVANLQASIADYDAILVTLTAEVARTYVTIRTIQQRLAVTRENVKIQKRSLYIAEVRFKAGAVTELDVTQARSLLRSTEATIPPLETGLRQAKNAMAILLGKLPGEIDGLLGGGGSIPSIPSEVTVGIPAQLLRRRPDIRLAERQLAAQSALIGVAKADLLPQFSLVGSLGFQASSGVGNRSNNSNASDLFNGNSFTYLGGASVSWDIFNYGRITNNIRVQDARFQALAVNYENRVLEAVREVEDAVIAFLRSQETVGFLTDAVKASRRSVDISMIQYREGLVDYQRVLDAQKSLSEQEDNLVSTAGSVAVNLVSMYKALGGGWQIRKGHEFVSRKIREQMRQRTNWDGLMAPDALKMPPSQDVKAILHRPDW